MQTSNAPKSRFRYLRLSITDRCALQCVYCMPFRKSSEYPASTLSKHDISTLVAAFAAHGVAKVRLTGGEPLVRADVAAIVEAIAQTPGITTVGLTTNGICLRELAPELIRAGLQTVNISLDTLDPQVFRKITGRDQLDQVLDGIYSVLECGFPKVKLNTVVMRGINDLELPAFAEVAKRLPVEVRFIELMPFDRAENEWVAMYVPASEIRRTLGALEPLEAPENSSARLYALPGGKGTVGIISAISEPFCAECNRIRVTSSGKLKPCLRLPVMEDLKPILHESDFVGRLGVLLDKLSCHRLSGVSAAMNPVEAETMCSVGG